MEKVDKSEIESEIDRLDRIEIPSVVLRGAEARGEQAGVHRPRPVDDACEPRHVATSDIQGKKVYPTTIEVDPSAASYILQLQRDGMRRARSATNEVLGGIRKIASMLSSGELVICRTCPWLIYTMSTYSWDKEAGTDVVIKEADHPIDALRYVINSL